MSTDLLEQTQQTPQKSESPQKRVADLNKPLDPDKLAHYVPVGLMDEKIMGAKVTVHALCGFTWTQQETADVNTYARGRSTRREVCPVCHVMRGQRNGGPFDAENWGS